MAEVLQERVATDDIGDLVTQLLAGGDLTDSTRCDADELQTIRDELRAYLVDSIESLDCVPPFELVYPCEYEDDEEAAVENSRLFSQSLQEGREHARNMVHAGDFTFGDIFTVLAVCPPPDLYTEWALKPSNWYKVVSALSCCRPFFVDCPPGRRYLTSRTQGDREFVAGCISELSRLLSTIPVEF